MNLKGSVPWEWLATCRKCGKSHEYRPENCSCKSHSGLKTWASPDDGHAYESRVSPWLIEALMAEHADETKAGVKQPPPQ